jgi:aldehyde dehydrogenase (NAD+)
MSFQELLENQRNYFNSGATRSYAFRKTQLEKLKAALLQHEYEIYAALKADLGKSDTEAYASELGLVLTELNTHLRKLNSWMKPKSISTNLVNLPSSSKMYYDPLGVVLIIAPWNYPFQLLLNPLVGAISAGNCAVLKPSELTPHTEAVIEKIMQSLYDEHYVAVLKGNGAEVVPELMQHFRFDHVFFTGSIPVGKAVYEMAAKQLVPVTLELGGKSPTIIHADADLKTAAKRIAVGKWINVGQTCIAPDYILIEESVKPIFVQHLIDTIKQFYGNAANSEDYGKIVNEKRFDTLVSYLQHGHIIYGGEHDKINRFIGPTLLDQVSLDSPLMKEEIFGPLLPILTFQTKEEALAIVQRNNHPLSFYVFTNSSAVSEWWMQHVPFGGGCINNTVYHFTNEHFHFGGIGNSGIGSYHGYKSFETFSHAKPVLKTPNWFDPALKYPPFKGKLKLFKWLIK